MATSGTGLDVRGIVSQLMQIESRPLKTLQQRRTDLDTRKAVFTDLRTKLSDLRSQTRTLTDALSNPFAAKSVTSSNTSVATGTAGANAVAGQHSLFVEQLARSHTLVSNRITGGDTDLVATVGTGDKTFTITLNGVDTEVAVTLEADDTNQDVLGKIVAAVNDAFYGADHKIVASLVRDTSTTAKIVLASADTGLAYKMTLADTSGALLGAVGIDNESVQATETTGGYMYADGQLDAKITLDGISITRGSNTVSDVLTGVTLSLLNAQQSGANPLTITVAADVASVKESVQNFLDKYNAALAYVRAKTKVSRNERGALADDFTVRGLALSLRSAAMDPVSGVNAGDYQLLSQIGITAGSDGTLSLSDQSAFTNAVTADPTAVSNLFRLTSGVARRVDDLLSPFVRAKGFLDDSVSVLQTQVSSVDEAIDRMQERLEKRQDYLTAQYARLAEVINQYQAQMTLIQQIQNWYGSNTR